MVSHTSYNVMSMPPQTENVPVLNGGKLVAQLDHFGGDPLQINDQLRVFRHKLLLLISLQQLKRLKSFRYSYCGCFRCVFESL